MHFIRLFPWPIDLAVDVHGAFQEFTVKRRPAGVPVSDLRATAVADGDVEAEFNGWGDGFRVQLGELGAELNMVGKLVRQVDEVRKEIVGFWGFELEICPRSED